MLDQEQILQFDPAGSQAGSSTQAARQTQAPRQVQADSDRPRHQGSLLVLAGEHAPEVLVAWRSTVQHTQHIHPRFCCRWSRSQLRASVVVLPLPHGGGGGGAGSVTGAWAPCR